MLFYDNFYGQINFIYFTVEFISVKSNKSKLSVYDMRIFAKYSHHNNLAAGADWTIHIAPRLRSTLRASDATLRHSERTALGLGWNEREKITFFRGLYLIPRYIRTILIATF